MDDASLLSTLLDLTEELGISVRIISQAGDSTEHPGGSVVRLKGKEVVFLNSAASSVEQAVVVAEALSGHDEMQQRYLAPEIRQLIEQARM
jgi:hypothetical protein